jgi:hypothetical protein
MICFRIWRSGGVPGVSGRAAGAAGAEQDADLPGRCRAGGGRAVSGDAAAAVLSLGGVLGRRPGQRPAVGVVAGCCGSGPARGRGAGHRRFRGPQGRCRHRARGPAVAGPLRQDRQRDRHRHHAVGRRTGIPAARPYTPARHFPKGNNDPAFRTKLQIGAELARQADQAGFGFRAVAADSAYGDQDNFRGELLERIGDATPPCGAPLSVAFHSQSSRYPACSMFRSSRRNRLS